MSTNRQVLFAEMMQSSGCGEKCGDNVGGICIPGNFDDRGETVRYIEDPGTVGSGAVRK